MLHGQAIVLNALALVHFHWKCLHKCSVPSLHVLCLHTFLCLLIAPEGLSHHIHLAQVLSVWCFLM
jgi:hypothetical protein